jgi:hypothetical protein
MSETVGRKNDQRVRTCWSNALKKMVQVGWCLGALERQACLLGIAS